MKYLKWSILTANIGDINTDTKCTPQKFKICITYFLNKPRKLKLFIFIYYVSIFLVKLKIINIVAICYMPLSCALSCYYWCGGLDDSAFDDPKRYSILD